MDFEIIIRNATLAETRELFAAMPAGATIKNTEQKSAEPAYAAAPWSQPEKDLICACSGGRDAVDEYFKQFRDSKRTRSAVQKMWSKFNSEKPKDKSPKVLIEEYDGGPETLIKVKQSVKSMPLINEQKEPVEIIHAGIIEAGQNPNAIQQARPKKPFHSKWQIPFDGKTERTSYQNAWNLCRKYNLPYPEAVIKQAEEDTAFNKGQIKKPSPVTINLVDHPQYKNHSPVTMDEIPKSESVVGWRVRQIKADRGRTIPGILLVTARKNGSGLIECLHEGKRQIIDATCLEVVERV